MPSFIGAEGWGAEAIGGRGGVVLFVDNLNDSGAGSLRDALISGSQATVPRTIVFRVSGIILLDSPLKIRAVNSFLTIAGQTAPDGIAIGPAAGNEAWIGADDIPETGNDTQHIIVRHLRCRAGRGGSDPTSQRFASFWSGGGGFGGALHNLMVDHCSFTWGQDQTLNIGHNQPVHTTTHSYNIIGEQGTAQDAAAFLTGTTANIQHTFHHNYVAHSFVRNYLISDGGEWSFFNEVRYNCDWTYNVSIPGTGISMDVINNYVQRGPTFGGQQPLDYSVPGAPATSTYATGNKLVSTTGSVLLDGDWIANGTSLRNGATFTERLTPLAQSPNPVTVHTADTGKDLVLAGAGPRPLDSVDARMLGDFGTPGIARNLANIGDFANYSLTAGNFTPSAIPPDTNNNGMSDEFEARMSVSNHNGLEISTSRGLGEPYENLEWYLMELAGDISPLSGSSIQSMLLDPNAPAFTDNQIIDKINAATNNITRAASVVAVARPLVAGEVTTVELDPTAIKDNLDALVDITRAYLKTNPITGEFKITSIHRRADGKLELEYDDVAV